MYLLFIYLNNFSDKVTRIDPKDHKDLIEGSFPCQNTTMKHVESAH